MFRDRREAGARLADALLRFKEERVVVLALPRGGVEVGSEVARALGSPLDTLVARKIGAPDNPEYAMGAVAPRGVRVVDERIDVENVVRDETREMERRIEKYKSGSYVRGAEPEVVIVVDDGVATGYTGKAALLSARAAYPEALLVFAAPVGAPDSVAMLGGQANEVVVLETPADFGAVGEWYAHFPQLRDEEVVGLLEKVARVE